jgi:hypothetical protein
MRPSNKSRSRNKSGGNGSHQRRNPMGNIINRVFESAGPDGKVRGTPQQIIDKYQALARDAQVAGDRVAAESYLQHSEHYSRLLGEAQRQQMESRLASSERDEPRPSQSGGSGDEGGFEPQRRQPHYPQPVASGLTTIDTDDGEDFGGPIETPEERRARRDEPAPIVEMRAPQASGRGERAPRPAAQGERAPRPAAAPQAEPAPQPPEAQAEPAPQAAPPAAAAEIEAAAAAAEAQPQPEEARAEEAPAPKPKRTRRRRTAEAPAEPSAQPETAPVSE